MLSFLSFEPSSRSAASDARSAASDLRLSARAAPAAAIYSPLRCSETSSRSKAVLRVTIAFSAQMSLSFLCFTAALRIASATTMPPASTACCWRVRSHGCPSMFGEQQQLFWIFLLERKSQSCAFVSHDDITMKMKND